MEFLMAMVVFPLLSFVAGVAGQLVIRRMAVVVGMVFVGWLVATFTIFNATFLGWALVYSALAFLGCGLVYWWRKGKGL